MRSTPFLTLVILAAVSRPLAGQAVSDVQVSPPELHLDAGEKTQVGATAYTEGGDAVMGASFRWTTTDSGVVRVEADPVMGVATLVAVAPGAAVIEARSGKARGFATVDVKGAAPPIAEATATAEARRRLATCSMLITPPPAGSWVEWETDKGRLWLAFLGTEERAGVRLYRTELAMTSGGQAGMVMQLLSPTWPYTGQRLAEVTIQMPGRPVRRLSAQQLATMRMQTPSTPLRAAAARCKEMTNEGTETITVPAGTFQAHHFHDDERAFETWIDPAVPFGLIKSTVRGGGEVMLVARGTGAESRITEAPAAGRRGGRERPRRD